MVIIRENINSTASNFSVTCKHCDSKSISLQKNGARYDDEDDEYFFVCNNCKNHWGII